ncbi:ABC transporter permease [Candidatus Nitronereus thalassa]|uniref:Transport permease protein n=1 Tax=Candidatus Nitronereus thalassa TaxID=3020898 RepID=A0ABU3K4N2_9BACT|nr:ABC transporter permease [Candidatus Nitronereus thalassa]MDT7041351.1 ABC transporter permease [Candidatus Nitronereus thalassa]
MNIGRISALIARHMYLYRRSFPRLLEIFYWPLLDLVVWGFITVYLAQEGNSMHGAVTFFLGALIFWDILFRAQQGVTISFLEEIWSRNLMNLFASPLTAGEFLTATMAMSVFKVAAVSIIMAFSALFFYSYNVFIMGLTLIPFVLNLIAAGWIIGILTMSVIMRFGQQAEVLAWGLVFLFQPISCVFYPVSVLPTWLQPVALANPAAHVFEGMRGVLLNQSVPWEHLGWATGLNALYLLIIITIYQYTFSVCKERGMLVRVGE